MTELPGHVVVVPCFDEAARLDIEAFEDLVAGAPDDRVTSVLFVDDGSTDGTGDLVERAAAAHAWVGFLGLGHNSGKGEAVRRGMLAAVESGAATVGYLDADLATPTDEYRRLAASLAADADLDGVMGARVALLGHDIRRERPRHYLGRVFATAASIVLDAEVYDTQCGAKVFRVTPHLERSLAEPFTDRWSFDVELLGRLLATGATIREEPLERWGEEPGSKLGFGGSLRSAWSLIRIRRRLRSFERSLV